MGRKQPFSQQQQKKLFALLEIPFHPSVIEWRVVRRSYDSQRGAVLPFANPRAYSDRLNELFTPAGWEREYSITHVSSLVREDRGTPTVTSKVLVACTVTIHRLGSQCGTGEEWADREHGVTAADAQAFKRACSAFGLGRYLYDFREVWVPLDSRGQPTVKPLLPAWALPPGVIAVPVGQQGAGIKGPIDPDLSAQINALRSALGRAIFGEILHRAGHSQDVDTIPNKELQKEALRWMQAADRGLQRVHVLANKVGSERFMQVAERLAITSIDELPSLEVLKNLVNELESTGKRRAA